MALTRDFKATVVSRVKSDPAVAQALLDEALAEDLPKPSKSLHRMLSRSGNPTLANFSAVLGAIRKFLRVDVRAVVSIR